MKRTSLGFGLLVVGVATAFCAVVLLDFGFLPSSQAAPQHWIDAARQVGAINVVSSVYLNVRLLDTLLEVLVFAVAVLGVRFFLAARGRPEPAEEIPESSVVRVAAGILLPLLLIISIFVTVHGHLSPGGGFAGGVIAGSGLLLGAIALGTNAVSSRLGGRLLGRLEWGALLGILVLALVPIFAGRPALSDLLPAGDPGHLGSGGSILLYNGLIGLKVFAASWLIARHFVDHRGEI